MGIYIKGLDWPELGIPIRITIFNDGAVNEEGIADYQAVEVKTPHGDLIDADELWEHIGRDRLDSRELIMKIVDNAPTVIKAEPNEDCRTCRNYNTEKCNMCGIEANYYEKGVPSAEKQGEWIWNQYDGNPAIGNYHCSICRWLVPHDKYAFCPNCGADMRSEETIAEADRMKPNEDDLIERITDRLIEKLSFSPVVILCDKLPETGKSGHIYVVGIKQYMWQEDAWERIN